MTNLPWNLRLEIANTRLIFLLKFENVLPRANGIIFSDATAVCVLSLH